MSRPSEDDKAWIEADFVPVWLRSFTFQGSARFTRTPDRLLRPPEEAEAGEAVAPAATHVSLTPPPAAYDADSGELVPAEGHRSYMEALKAAFATPTPVEEAESPMAMEDGALPAVAGWPDDVPGADETRDATFAAQDESPEDAFEAASGTDDEDFPEDGHFAPEPAAGNATEGGDEFASGQAGMQETHDEVAENVTTAGPAQAVVTVEGARSYLDVLRAATSAPRAAAPEAGVPLRNAQSWPVPAGIADREDEAPEGLAGEADAAAEAVEAEPAPAVSEAAPESVAVPDLSTFAEPASRSYLDVLRAAWAAPHPVAEPPLSRLPEAEPEGCEQGGEIPAVDCAAGDLAPETGAMSGDFMTDIDTAPVLPPLAGNAVTDELAALADAAGDDSRKDSMMETMEQAGIGGQDDYLPPQPETAMGMVAGVAAAAEAGQVAISLPAPARLAALPGLFLLGGAAFVAELATDQDLLPTVAAGHDAEPEVASDAADLVAAMDEADIVEIAPPVPMLDALGLVIDPEFEPEFGAGMDIASLAGSQTATGWDFAGEDEPDDIFDEPEVTPAEAIADGEDDAEPEAEDEAGLDAEDASDAADVADVVVPELPVEELSVGEPAVVVAPAPAVTVPAPAAAVSVPVLFGAGGVTMTASFSWQQPFGLVPLAPVARPSAPAVAEEDEDADAPAEAAKAPVPYELPELELLKEPPAIEPDYELSEAFLDQNSLALQQVLRDFGVRGEVIDANPGPVVTLYEFEPAPGVKSSRVIGLADDIARSMSAISARVAVVPGRNVIGIELPNRRRDTVWLRELLASHEYVETRTRLGICLGKSIGGEPLVADLARMPHLLVAGTTGSGKSVAINTMILSLLYRYSPEQCRLIMIDPKMLELSVYEGIPHLLTPVVTDPKKAIVALKWAVREMEERYRKMARLAVRNIDGYNTRMAEARVRGEVITRPVQVGFDKESGEVLFEEQQMDLSPLPYIVIVVDEMADLMMVAGKDIETAIQRLAQMARAAGIHLVMATQRPSVDVITGTIKANFPTRISFQVTSKIDSRTILGEMGAETLLGQGDMLFMAAGGRITRVHGAFVSDVEVENVVAFLKTQGQPEYLEEVVLEEETDSPTEAEEPVFDRTAIAGDTSSDLYEQAVAIVMRDRKASTSYIQRRLQVGYNRAASLMERMEQEGIVGPANHAGKREILQTSR